MKFKKVNIILLFTQFINAFFDNTCFQFYTGGDLGIGFFNIYNSSSSNESIQNKSVSESSCLNASEIVFIGGARGGIAWTASEYWYAAIEGNIHSASGKTKNLIETNINGKDNNYLIKNLFLCKTKFIAGFHGQLGYKLDQNLIIYGIAGYKYLRNQINIDNYFTDYKVNLVLNSTDENSFYFNNNGWSLGLGMSYDFGCNISMHFESIYSRFKNIYFDGKFNFLNDTEEISIINKSNLNIRLLYSVFSLVYNF